MTQTERLCRFLRTPMGKAIERLEVAAFHKGKLVGNKKIWHWIPPHRQRFKAADVRQKEAWDDLINIMTPFIEDGEGRQ